MTQNDAQTFNRLDSYESNTHPTRIEILDAIENGKIPLYIKCDRQQGLIFSVKNDKATAHCLGEYDGYLKLSYEASALLSENGEHLVKAGVIDEINKFKVSDLALPNSHDGIYESFEPFLVDSNKTYGLFVNVKGLGHDLEESLQSNKRLQVLMRDQYIYELDISPFSETLGTRRDGFVWGKEYKISKARVKGEDIEKLKKLIEADEPSPKKGFKKTSLNYVLVRIIKKYSHFSADEVWREMEKELNREVREFDIDYILTPSENQNPEVISLGWIDKKGDKKTVFRKGFDQRLSRLRQATGIGKS